MLFWTSREIGFEFCLENATFINCVLESLLHLFILIGHFNDSFPKPKKMFPPPKSSAESIKEKFETICKKYFPGSASEDSLLLFPLSSKLFHYFLCTINLLMDRIAGCKNTRRRKINFEFRGFLNFAKSVSGQISLHSFDKKSWLNDETFWLARQKDNTVCQHEDDYLFSLT